MMHLGSQYNNTTRSYAVRARDDQQIGLATPYAFTGSEALQAVLWTGDDVLSVATAQAAWLDATADPPTVNLTITRSVIGVLTGGQYRWQIIVEPNGTATEFATGTIEVLEGPGGATAAKAYCTYQDCLTVYPGLGRLVTENSGIRSDLSEYRAKARAWTENILHFHYRPGDTPSRESWNDWELAGQRDTQGHFPQLQTWLDADYLMLGTPNGKRIVDANAKHAVASVLLAQIDESGNSPYQELARRLMLSAGSIMQTVVADLDTDGDGLANVRIDCAIADTLRG